MRVLLQMQTRTNLTYKTCLSFKFCAIHRDNQ